jgi:hypothetical protein
VTVYIVESLDFTYLYTYCGCSYMAATDIATFLYARGHIPEGVGVVDMACSLTPATQRILQWATQQHDQT